MAVTKVVRQLLAAGLGTERYLHLISSTYIRLVNAGLMRSKYPELFYLSSCVSSGCTCIDLGANVGYYTTRLSRLCGANGKVYAVEPVNLFRNILTKNISRFALKNIEVMPFALGAENKTITMATPVIDGVFRHGLTQVVENNTGNFAQTYTAEMKIPDELFSGLTRLDFIKCDVEGYETYIFPHFIKTLQHFKPLIQIEISEEANRREMFRLLNGIGYECCMLAGKNLEKIDEPAMLSYRGGDFYFRPTNRPHQQ